MLGLREPNDCESCHSGLSEIQLSQARCFLSRLTLLRCSLTCLGFYSLRKEIASIKAAETTGS